MNFFNFLFAFISIVAICVGADLPGLELQALKSIYSYANGDQWKHKDNWLVDGTDPCTWYGVICSPDGNHVQGLALPNNGLDGDVADQICDLQNLTFLDLSANKLGGELPYHFPSLTNLKSVYVSDNDFNGYFDASKLVNLEYFYGDFNYFGVNLKHFCSCKSLKALSFVYNNVGDEFPSCLMDLPNLQYLQVGVNQIYGNLPDHYAPTLRGLDLSRNQIQASSPFLDKFMACPDLGELSFFGSCFATNLSGLSGHSSLNVFDGHVGCFNGKIPDDYPGSIRNLYAFNLRKDRLIGFLPKSFTDCTVPFFDFSYNYLYCPLPNVPPYSATCTYWTLQSVDPTSCPVGQECKVTITGSNFFFDDDVKCAFGSLSVPANIVTLDTITCSVTGQEAGHVNLVITQQDTIISDGNLGFDFTASNDNKHVPVVRKLNDEPVHVRIHGSSKTPEFATVITAFQKIMHALGTDVVDLQIGFVMELFPYYVTGFWSRRGQTEVIGNALIKLVEKKYGIVTAVDFAACLAEQFDTIPNNGAECAKKFNIDFDDLRKNTFNLNIYNELRKALDLANSDGAKWSPTIVINDEIYCLWGSAPCKAKKDTDFLRAICDAYKGPTPAACQ